MSFLTGATMFYIILNVVLVFIAPCVTDRSISREVSFRSEKHDHMPISLTDDQIIALSELSNVTHMNEVLDNICVVRVVGTPQHAAVKEYIKASMRKLNWSVETDTFTDDVPIFGNLEFENIIAKLNPNARRYLTLACHYDSKYFREGTFVGAMDSAVPCAQLINLATVMKNHLKSIERQNVSLMFIFFDGEEAFRQWGPTDSIYGARHLAKIWHNTLNTYGQENDITDLHKMDMLILLDLIGAPDPRFYNYFVDTERWYAKIFSIESRLAKLRQLIAYSYGKPEQRYFQGYSVSTRIEDDHIPFLEKDVPIMHIIPSPFPQHWHELEDNRRNIDLNTTENISKILRVFVASYLHINI